MARPGIVHALLDEIAAASVTSMQVSSGVLCLHFGCGAPVLLQRGACAHRSVACRTREHQPAAAAADQWCHAPQSRPAEAALLTALLAHDPKRRPAIDDVLRSGLLRKLHAGLTKRPPVTTPPPRTPSAAAAALASPSLPAAAAAASSLQLVSSQQQQQQQTTVATPQHGQAVSKSAAVPAAALAAHLGSGGVLQDFLQLARESVATDASHLSAQISILDQVWRHSCLSLWLFALGSMKH